MTLQQLLAIELPIIQAPMAGVQDHRLAVAVSNAGGLGSLPAAMLSLEALRSELMALQAQTRKPYNVNFFCHTPPTPDATREAAWRAWLRARMASEPFTLRELVVELAERGLRVDYRTMWKFAHGEGLSFKKNRARQ